MSKFIKYRFINSNGKNKKDVEEAIKWAEPYNLEFVRFSRIDGYPIYELDVINININKILDLYEWKKIDFPPGGEIVNPEWNGIKYVYDDGMG